MDIYVRELNRYIPVPKELQGSRYQARFARFIAQEYRRRLKKAVITQELAAGWKPLNAAYKQHKIETGLNPGMWIATSRLINSIVVVKTGMRFEVGIDKRKKTTPGGEYLYDVALALEYGSGKIPPRPLFRPVYLSMIKDMNMLAMRFVGGLR